MGGGDRLAPGKKNRTLKEIQKTAVGKIQDNAPCDNFHRLPPLIGNAGKMKIYVDALLIVNNNSYRLRKVLIGMMTGPVDNLKGLF